jgi:hypothetical protein
MAGDPESEVDERHDHVNNNNNGADALSSSSSGVHQCNNHALPLPLPALQASQATINKLRGVFVVCACLPLSHLMTSWIQVNNWAPRLPTDYDIARRRHHLPAVPTRNTHNQQVVSPPTFVKARRQAPFPCRFIPNSACSKISLPLAFAPA